MTHDTRLTTEDMARAGESVRERREEEDDDVDTVDTVDTLENENASLFAGDEAGRFRERWNAIQTGFVDEPRRAVQDADALVAEIMKRLAEVFAGERSTLEHQWDRGDNVTTEDLRIALQRYRSSSDGCWLCRRQTRGVARGHPCVDTKAYRLQQIAGRRLERVLDFQQRLQLAVDVAAGMARSRSAARAAPFGGQVCRDDGPRICPSPPSGAGISRYRVVDDVVDDASRGNRGGRVRPPVPEPFADDAGN